MLSDVRFLFPSNQVNEACVGGAFIFCAVWYWSMCWDSCPNALGALHTCKQKKKRKEESASYGTKFGLKFILCLIMAVWCMCVIRNTSKTEIPYLSGSVTYLRKQQGTLI